MCGRFVAASDPDQLAAWFDVDDRRTDALPVSYNVAPTMPVYAVTEHADHRYLVSFRWGLVPTWSDDPKSGARMINARSETVADKPAYRTALRRRRCIIPADGFYEWRTHPHGKTPYYIHRADGRPLAFAGLWEGWKSPDGEWLRTCAIITGVADERLTDLHPRMPIILRPDTWEVWLDRAERRPDAVLDLLVDPDVDHLSWHAVGDRVNHVRNDDPALIEPAARRSTASDATAHFDTST
ncbi:MAG: SOS response-associated peptidase [Actinobacteria bacterium]|nr:SOS response-associated peptidase [Actinomycetota bacterium]